LSDNALKDKSYQFSLEIIRLYQYLKETKKEFILSKQLLRSGTSIGANIIEANAAQSKKEFIAKLNISLKEAKESEYWLNLLKDSGYISKMDMIEKVQELSRLLTSIILKTKENLQKTKESQN
jgi:four helix bundle protein